MCNLINQYKVEREIYLRHPKDRCSLKLAQIFMQLTDMHEELSHKIIANKIYEPYCAFVTF